LSLAAEELCDNAQESAPRDDEQKSPIPDRLALREQAPEIGDKTDIHGTFLTLRVPPVEGRPQKYDSLTLHLNVYTPFKKRNTGNSVFLSLAELAALSIVFHAFERKSGNLALEGADARTNAGTAEPVESMMPRFEG